MKKNSFLILSTLALASVIFTSCDTPSGQGTGFLFHDYEAPAMLAALKRALAIRRQPGMWARLQRNGMARDFSWRRSAEGYDALYAEARERVKAGRVMTLETARTRV